MFVRFSQTDAAKMRDKAAGCRHRAQDQPTSDASHGLMALFEEYELEARELKRIPVILKHSLHA
jgi:hypothetical protein